MILEWLKNSLLAPGWISNVFWDFVVGLLVFLFTVYFVDRSAKKRDEKRWKPSIDIVHSQILSLMSNFLTLILRPITEDDLKLVGYRFGEVQVTLIDRLAKVDKKDRFKVIQRSINPRNSFDYKDFEELGRRLADILAISGFLLGPEILSLLVKLNGEVENIIRIKTGGFPTEIIIKNFDVYRMQEIINIVGQIIDYLNKIADNTLEDMRGVNGVLPTVP